MAAENKTGRKISQHESSRDTPNPSASKGRENENHLRGKNHDRIGTKSLQNQLVPWVVDALLLSCAGLFIDRSPHYEAVLNVLDQILPYLTPSEQAVYLRLWRLTHADDKTRCAIRYEDLARGAHVSISTLKRVLKKLAQRNLVQVEWQAKHASLFTVHVRSLSPSPTIDLGLSPKLYDYFTDDDRSLFLSCKRSLSPQDQKALNQEAHGNPLLADVLLFRRTFGPDRQRHYETLIEHLIQNGRPN